MKLLALSLALTLGAVTLFGQESARPTAGEAPVLLAQVRRPAAAEPAVETDPATADDTMRIKAPPSPSATGAAESAPATVVNLWNLVKSGGWAMIPLGFLSVMTGMLVLVYVFTLRRSSILTPHYMNTADVLLKKRDYLGLLAISSRHSEAVARVVQRTLDFATKNPGASYEIVKDIAETEGSSQAASLQNRTVYLADIGVLAPMIGLFGTVLGIIRAFGVLASGSIAQSRDVLLAEGRLGSTRRHGGGPDCRHRRHGLLLALPQSRAESDLGSRDRLGARPRLDRRELQQEARVFAARRSKRNSKPARLMKFRRRTTPHVLGFQIAPMVDILLVLLCFFIVTWSFARKEMELDVKVPAAESSTESRAVMNQTVLNVKADGTIVWNRKAIAAEELRGKLLQLSSLYPDYAIILRGDERANYKSIVNVLDICREAKIWNVAFATGKVE
jgi:biopolymer transport protein ExbD/biopolymer transport protein ExbB/TolQ